MNANVQGGMPNFDSVLILEKNNFKFVLFFFPNLKKFLINVGFFFLRLWRIEPFLFHLIPGTKWVPEEFSDVDKQQRRENRIVYFYFTYKTTGWAYLYRPKKLKRCQMT